MHAHALASWEFFSSCFSLTHASFFFVFPSLSCGAWPGGAQNASRTPNWSHSDHASKAVAALAASFSRSSFFARAAALSFSTPRPPFWLPFGLVSLRGKRPCRSAGLNAGGFGLMIRHRRLISPVLLGLSPCWSTGRQCRCGR